MANSIYAFESCGSAVILRLRAEPLRNLPKLSRKPDAEV